MIGVQGGADGQTFIAGRGLDPCTTKWSVIEQFSVRYAVQRAPASHDQVVQRDALMQLVKQVKENFLELMLHGIREIHVTLCDFTVRFTRLAKEFSHTIRKM